MAKRGKATIEARSKIDRLQRYTFDDGVSLAIGATFAKFDESVDVAVNLGVDPRKSDQMVRGTVVLPHGTGKEVRVLVFAKGEKEKEATDAGADYAGAEDLIEKIQGGWLDFDKAVATPDMMGQVGKLGKILGPRKLMPNAKLGTVTFDVGKTVKELKGGKIEFRVEKTGVVHAPVGKVSFGKERLIENLGSFFDALMRAKPTSSKGAYLKNIAVSTTMGPGVKIDPNDVRTLIKASVA